MQFKEDIPIQSCDEKKRDLQDQGYEIKSCEPKADDPETCEIIYSDPE
jgi:hypothetical protein